MSGKESRGGAGGLGRFLLKVRKSRKRRLRCGSADAEPWHLEISLPSGRSGCFQCSPESTVGELKVRAQQFFRSGFLRLFSKDRCLSPCESLAGLRDEHLTAAVAKVKIAASLAAFSIWSFNGPVVVWGNPHSGGENYDVEHLLQNVQQIKAADTAFAAILGNGSVVTWGDPTWGGFSDDVVLQNVRSISGSSTSFGAVLQNGHPGGSR